MQELDLGILKNGKFIRQGISYPGLMASRIKKSSSFLQPLFEAFSNSWEAVCDNDYDITIELCHNKAQTLFGEECSFSSLQIVDHGYGFTDESFERFSRLFDKTKNKNNLGTGRVQFLHSFQYTQIDSIYLESDGCKYRRRILLSLSFEDKHKAVICATTPTKVEYDSEIQTIVAFFSVLDDEDRKKINKLSCVEIKDIVLKRYLNKFCLEREHLNKIQINHYVNEAFDNEGSAAITIDDIPTPDYEDSFDIHYSILGEKGKSIDVCMDTEKFETRGYKLPSSILSKNEVRLTSKGESFATPGCDFALITEAPRIESHICFLFLISSNYLTQKDSDVRGNLDIYTRSHFLENRNLFMGRKEILIDDIETKAEDKIIARYPSFRQAKDKADKNLDALAKMFSINRKTMEDAGVKSSDSDSVILRKVYTHSANRKAENDTKIKIIVDSISNLDPNDKRFQSQLNKKVSELNKALPISVKEELSNYIARRTLVLSLMEQAINERLKIQLKEKTGKKSGKKGNSKSQPEAILHNILFPKHSSSPIESNLWMLNDEYIHFEGLSETELNDVIIGGKKLFKENLSSEEEAYKLRNQGTLDVGMRRPDVLLFPEEGRCIIIEFKAPGVDVSKHLHQINQYASLIHNLSDESFKFNSFYGYLIGENADIYSVIDSDGDFQFSQSLGYIVRPHKGIPDLFGRGAASLYTEIIKFSDLLKRAKLRNKIFTDSING